MTRVLRRAALAAAVVCVTAGASLAQQTTSSTEVKTFEVIAIEGNTLVVNLPEGTREITVPDDFRFTVNGQPLSVRELRPGMKGTASITTRTTVTPVVVTEVKNGTVVQRAGGNLIVRTEEGVKMFSQGDVDKRGVKLVRAGKPAQLTDFREGDRMSATIITTMPPRVMTEKEVEAVVATRAAAPAAPTRTAAAAPSSAPAPPPLPGEAPRPRTLPKTASALPLLALTSLLSLATGLALTARRRFSR